MAKEIKNIQITVVSEEDSTTYEKAVVTYCVCSVDDSGLSKMKGKEMVLSGDDLTDAVALLAKAVTEAESDEGIS